MDTPTSVSFACSAFLIAIGTSRVWCPDERLEKRFLVLVLVIAAFLSADFQSRRHAASLVALATWYPLTRRISSTWPNVANRFVSLPSWVYAGPLGKGCSKVVEVLLACLLWRTTRGTIPLIFFPKNQAFSIKKAIIQTGVLISCSIAVNFVLLIWSRNTQNKGHDHFGTRSMKKYSENTKDTSFTTLRHQLELMSLSAMNAVCEECTSRGIWRREFVVTANLSWTIANVAQAIIFGVWHFHGIPSGWIGIVLTFVYGLLMGWLSDWSGGGLLLPVLAHTIADYYIFAVIMRQKDIGNAM